MMTKKMLIQLLLLTILFSCSKDDEYEFALIQTGDVTDIDVSGATFHARISDISNDNIVEYGFIWNISGNEAESGISEKYIIARPPSVRIVSERISTTLEEGKAYDVRAFMRNSKYTTYGETITFTSLGSTAPIITDFYPKAGNLNDTLYILGQNFSHNSENNIVSFGQLTTEVIKSSQDTLVVIVPEQLNSENVPLSVSILNNKSVALNPFQLVAPTITDFNPKKSVFGSTIQISGTNFLSNRNSLQVKFGTSTAEIISVLDDLITVKAPLELDREVSKISVEMNNLTVTSENNFTLNLPKLSSFQPQTTTFGAEVELTGDLFTTGKKYLKVFVDEYQAEITSLTDNRISFIVPDSVNNRTSSVKIDINGIEIYSDRELSIAKLILDDFAPHKVTTGSSFTVSGNNFSPIPENNKILIGNVKGQVLEASVNSLTIQLPFQDTLIYLDRELTLSVEVMNDIQSFNDSLIVNDKWFRRADFPGSKTSNANYFVADNMAYVGLNDTKELWQFNPDKDEWIKMSDFPGSIRINGAGFHINGNIYFGTGFANNKSLNDFWQYNISTNSWSQKNNFEGSERAQATGFSIHDRGYITSGYYDQAFVYNHPDEDCWRFNPANDSWQEIESYGDLVWGSVDGLAGGTAVVTNGVAYYGLGWNFGNSIHGYEYKVFQYNPNTETKWKRITDFPYKRDRHRAISFELNDAPYFKTVASDFYQYNETTNSWNKVETSILSDITGGIGFSILGKAYVGLGNSKAIWEYDPTR